MNAPTLRIYVASFLFAASLAPVFSTAATYAYSGSVSRPASGFAALGTFKPGFDPYTYGRVYGDFAQNLLGSHAYSRSLADGNFRPITTGLWSGNTFAGSGTATGIASQQLWLLLYDNPNPDNAFDFAIFHGTQDSWFAPPDSGSTVIDANSADTFLFGMGGHGGPVVLNVMPFPEPSPVGCLSAAAAVALLLRRARSAPRETASR
jgi:hypothetical protein